MKSVEQYKSFLSKIANVINDNDPIHLIEIGAPLDEYLGEVSLIAPIVRADMSADELAQNIRDIFEKRFSKNTADTVSSEKYEKKAILIKGGRISGSLGAIVDLTISAQDIKKYITVKKQKPGF